MNPLRVTFTPGVGLMPAFWPQLKMVLEALGCTDIEGHAESRLEAGESYQIRPDDPFQVDLGPASAWGRVTFGVAPDIADVALGMNAIMTAADAVVVIVRREGLRVDAKDCHYKEVKQAPGWTLEGKYRGTVEFSGSGVVVVEPAS